LQARARGAESMVIEVGGRNGNLEPSAVQQKLERISGVSRVVCKNQVDSRAVFEIESQKGRLVRGDLARAVVESGWDLNELRPAAMSLEEVFLQLTGKEKDPAALPAATGAQS
jgi:ABC-2 type transport system ATP-binding protein